MWWSPEWDHPRSRGEYARGAGVGSPGSGSSPLSRGILAGVVGEGDAQRIIPALAGNTLPRFAYVSGRTDHPRSRGEYSAAVVVFVVPPGSSPLSRGIPIQRRNCLFCPRIIPALAGNTHPVGRSEGRQGDHPRSRGEYPFLSPEEVAALGSSPLSRGIRFSSGPGPRFPKIIPALAGNTFPRRRRVMAARDHPRSRGEYVAVLHVKNPSAGSSPLSRGILGWDDLFSPSERIIPALAGNTN